MPKREMPNLILTPSVFTNFPWDAKAWDANAWDAKAWDAKAWDAKAWDAKLFMHMLWISLFIIILNSYDVYT